MMVYFFNFNSFFEKHIVPILIAINYVCVIITSVAFTTTDISKRVFLTFAFHGN